MSGFDVLANGGVDSGVLEKLREVVPQLIEKQRERLAAQNGYVWWPDLVFMVRDMQALCVVVKAIGHGELAEPISEIAQKIVSVFIRVAIPDITDEQGEELLDKLVTDSIELEAITEKMIAQVMGEQVEH